MDAGLDGGGDVSMSSVRTARAGVPTEIKTSIRIYGRKQKKIKQGKIEEEGGNDVRGGGGKEQVILSIQYRITSGLGVGDTQNA